VSRVHFLNPQLDVDRLAADYAVHKRLQIQDVLDAGVAESVSRTLRASTPWSLVFNRGPQTIKHSSEELAKMGGAKVNEIVQETLKAAGHGFQFLYYAYPIVEAILEKRNPGHPLHDVLETLNSPEVLSFVSRVTGIGSLAKADGQATFYRLGSFLTFHNDLDEVKKRRVAYVLGFTRNWRPDWGGLLEFYDKKGDVEAGMLPRFNSLSIFTVPADHAVTYVAPYATEGRYSITGWFRE
jgi:Rps23 Pro-64 3,4-dihydroxylase Tpa1-like proline 4-hydroxylase